MLILKFICSLSFPSLSPLAFISSSPLTFISLSPLTISSPLALVSRCSLYATKCSGSVRCQFITVHAIMEIAHYVINQTRCRPSKGRRCNPDVDIYVHVETYLNVDFSSSAQVKNKSNSISNFLEKKSNFLVPIL